MVRIRRTKRMCGVSQQYSVIGMTWGEVMASIGALFAPPVLIEVTANVVVLIASTVDPELLLLGTYT